MKAIGIFSVLISLAACGCTSYTTPGRGANFKELGLSPQARRDATDFAPQEALDKKPLATFPTAIAVVRIQSPGYYARGCPTYGTGRYTIVTSRTVEREDQIERLSRLPLVNGIAPMNRLLLPETFESEMPLREAAARLHADILLIYTFDTVFREDQKAAPISVITLGASPTKTVDVTTTASAALIDTRNGYLYGLAEATASREKLTSAWATQDTIDASRRKNEEEAFDKLVGELEKTWTGVVNQYAVRAAVPVR